MVSVDSSPRPPRRRLRRVKLLVIGVVLALGVAELLLLPIEAVRPNPRYAPGELPDQVDHASFLRPVPEVGWRMQPDFCREHETEEFTVTYRSDAAGNRRGAAEPKAARRSVVLLGDSFTFGIGVEFEETYGALLEEALPDTRVHNLAIPGFGVDQMLLQLEDAGLDLEPDLVIVGVCDADFARSLSAYYHGSKLNKPAFRLEGGALVRRTAADRLPGPIRWLDERSRVWMAGRQLLRRLDYSRPTSAWWYLNEAILDRIRATCAEREVPVVFVYVPTPEWRPFPTLAAYMERVGATYVDLVADAPAQREDLHWPRDRHFTPAGHAYAATRLTAALEASGL